MSWEIVKLGEVCKVLPGFAFKSSLMGASGIPVLKIKNINDNLGVDTQDCQCIDEAYVPEKLAKFFVKKGDILLAMTGATAGKFGRISTEGRYLLNQRVAKIIPVKADANYIWSCLSDSAYRNLLYNMGQGAAQPNVSGGQIEALEIPLPPLFVQQKIASILSAYDDLIDNNRKRIALLEKAARLLYEEWFVRLQFPGHEHTPVVDGVPQGWERKTVDDIGTVITGKTPDTSRASYYGEDVPFIKTPDMHGNVYVIETESSLSKEGADVQPKKYLPKNAILVACIGAKLGVVSLSPGVSQTNQQINAVVVHDKAATYFAFFTLRDFKPRLEAIGGGATMPNVNKSKFGSLDFLLPSETLLRAFDEFCKPVFTQIMSLQIQTQKLQAARDLLLPRLMSGELAV